MAENPPTSVRTRIAPSPTGYPHIGTIYQALFNYAFAKKYGGQFIVRIEDTDRTRFVEGAEDVIFSALDWFGLKEDESPRKEGQVGPYRQSKRLKIYHEYVQKLLDQDKAYFAYYPKKDAGVKKYYTQKEDFKINVSDIVPQPEKPKSIAEMPENGDWIVRMKVPNNEQVIISDGIRGDITFDATQVTEQVLLKSDTYPTYHLAVVVDDHLMNINYVVRGEEWIPSTPKHVLLYTYFGWDLPSFFHTPDLRNPDKSKLSKRHGHTYVNWYKDEGYLPEAILNYLALLGWTHPEEKEVFSLEEFISVFDLKDIRVVGPIFDIKKLEWLNGLYIREKLSAEELKQRLVKFYQDDEEVQKILTGTQSDIFIRAATSRMKTLKEFKMLVQTTPERDYTDSEKELAKAFYHQLAVISDNWTEDSLLSQMKLFKEQQNINFKKIYFLLTGREQGLPLTELLVIYGKEFFLKNLQSHD